MKRLTSLLLLLLTLAFGLTVAAQGGGEAEGEIDREVDSHTAVEKGAEIDPAPGQVATSGRDERPAEIDASTIRTEAETDAAFAELAVRSEEPAGWPNTASQFLATQEDLSIFLMLLEQAGLTETLVEGDRPITIFAPNDEAFARMDQLQFSTMVEDPAALRAFLERHIASDGYSIADLSAGLDSSVEGGGPGEQAPTAGVDVDPAGARGGDGVIDIDPENAVNAETGTVAGGGPAGDTPSATVTTPDPRSFVRVDTRSGSDLEVGTRPASVRAELMRLSDSSVDSTSAVAGGGAAAETGAPTASSPGSYYVGDSQIVTADLGVEDVTVHVIDAVLLPAQGAASEDAETQ